MPRLSGLPLNSCCCFYRRAGRAGRAAPAPRCWGPALPRFLWESLTARVGRAFGSHLADVGRDKSTQVCPLSGRLGPSRCRVWELVILMGTENKFFTMQLPLLRCLSLRLELALLTGLCCVSSYSVTRVSQAFMGWETRSVSDFQLGQPHGNSGPVNDKVCPIPAGPGRREMKTRKD